MPTITVKNITQDIYNTIRQQAEAHHRSISNEIIHCLEENVSARQANMKNILQEARHFRKKAKGSLPYHDIEQAINEGRP